VRAELLPADKQRIVQGLKNEGLTVAKIGEGINDAPALAVADVGIAMGNGTDVTLETTDAAVLHGRVGDVAAMVTSRSAPCETSARILPAIVVTRNTPLRPLLEWPRGAARRCSSVHVSQFGGRT
jgi:hypothetical protein